MTKYKLTILLFLYYSFLIGQNKSLDWNSLKTLPQNTEIGIGIIENGKIEKFGFIVDNNELRLKENSKYLFEVGSITKVFTTLLALNILEERKIKLTESIVHYLPESANKTSDKITFQKLMTHTSGLPKMPNNFFWSAFRCPNDPFLHYCEKRMTRFLNKFNPSDNEEFLYSNLGMGLLGHLSSILENSTLDSLMKMEIFQTLKMESTTLGISSEQYTSVVNSKGIKQKPKRTWEFSDITKGAGNAYSNIDDMTQFLKFLLTTKENTNKIHSAILEMEKEQLSLSESEGMGLGWRIHKNKSKIRYHGGITYGFKSLVAYNRIQQKGIVILTNAKGLSRKENKILKDICFKYLEKKYSHSN